MMVRRTLFVTLLVLAGLTVATPAQAYLDPSTGSMVISAIVGLVAALALATKMFWYRTVGALRALGRRLGRRPASDDAS
jgi:hypothetical protein